MINTFFLCTFLFLSTTATADSYGCQFSEDAAEQSAKAVGNLAVQLYQKISKPDANTIFSPVSIALALALAESGAAGETEKVLQRFLNPPGSSQTDSSELYQSLQHQLQIQTENARLSIANGFFYADSLKLKNGYVNKMRQCFETQITNAPFATDAKGARQQINRWVSNATVKKIPELLKQGSVTPATTAVLANAIYFKAAWGNKFELTESGTFYQSGKSDQTQTVTFMIQTKHYQYISNDNFDAVELPYQLVPLSMYIILPKQRDGIQAVEQALTGDQLISLFDKSNNRKVALKFPKFTFRQSTDLGTILQQLGLQQVFSSEADFSRMAKSAMKISGAVHEAYIKVNEYGTEAAAATALVLAGAGLPPPSEQPVPFVADHPFLFAIVHKPTAAITFLGKVNSIQE